MYGVYKNIKKNRFEKTVPVKIKGKLKYFFVI